MFRRFVDQRQFALLRVAVCALVQGIAGASSMEAEETVLDAKVTATLQRYCFACHGGTLAEGGVNLEQLSSATDAGRGFKEWEKVVRMLRQRRMPPQKARSLADADRQTLISEIEQTLDAFIAKHAGDPGPVVIRRLTSAEYAYSIEDLTGLDLKIDRMLASDAVGGEGFTNVGSVQFMQDAVLERYLDAAKFVAGHAVVGAGRLSFFNDPGQTGRELSAIIRIQRLYRKHGFRTAAGEGAEPFGLDLYSRALLVAWRYRHRAALLQKDITLQQLAQAAGLSVRFCEHVWNVLQRSEDSYPLSEIVSRWKSLSAPGAAGGDETAVRSACEKIYGTMRDWQSTLAAAAGDEEEAAVLTASDVTVQPGHSFTTNINWEEGATEAALELSVASASRNAASGALVVWRNARLRFRSRDLRRGDAVPLSSVVVPETAALLKFGRHPTGGKIDAHDFVQRGESALPIRLLVPPGTRAARLTVDVELDFEHGSDSIVRCRITDGAAAGETAAEVGATSTLLANPKSPVLAAWQSGVAQFARLLPEVSHREPAPSDRDPIPPPFDNSYNMPERNHFHTTIKYHRDDAFLVEHVLDDAARRELDQAWVDLLTSFEYHDANLRFVAKKFNVDLDGKSIADVDEDAVARVSPELREYLRRLREEFIAMQVALRTAEPSHLDDALRLAERAWRRPLADDERQGLRDFYTHLRGETRLDHTKALRALLARILVAPAFLYRAEPSASKLPAQTVDVPLSDWELAGRLSYFLWSSIPDDELRRAAAAGELRRPEKIAAQTRRMLRDPRAQRLATEFFGQWLGFYRFPDHRGIDVGRFPEFNDALKSAMYDEAVAFFEHVVRSDRPVGEILFADYSFLNETLARHYGVDSLDLAPNRHVRVEGISGRHRGGLLGLGAVLTVTSAPLRTSAVKRGDWVLRRIVGNPVPPPPADAGSIPADDALADGLTVRKRLEAHRSDASCVNCHSRMDPLGFALENFDPIGRWRDTYRDGQPIDPAGTLNDGTELKGLDDLRRYLRREEPQFQRNLASKLLGYALGRAELASDRPLMEKMLTELKSTGRFSDLVVPLVTSRQFGYRRAEAATDR